MNRVKQIDVMLAGALVVWLLCMAVLGIGIF